MGDATSWKLVEILEKIKFVPVHQKELIVVQKTFEEVDADYFCALV